MYYKDGCPWSERAVDLLSRTPNVKLIEVSKLSEQRRQLIKDASGMQTWPQVWHTNKLIGGYVDLLAYVQK